MEPRVQGERDQLSWFVQDRGVSQDVEPSVLKPGNPKCVGHSDAHPRPQSSVQSDLIAYAAQVPASCTHNSYLCSRIKKDYIFDLHLIDVTIGRNKIAFVSF